MSLAKINNGVLKFYCAGASDNCLCWIRYTVFLISCMAFATAGELQGYWTRVNYGSVAIKTITVCLIDDFATHTMEIKLPTLTQMNVTNDSFTDPWDALCTRLRGVANLTRVLTASMQNSVSQALERIYDLIPVSVDTSPGQRRKPRALFSLGERIAHYLFGTAEDATVDELRKQINDQKFRSETGLSDGT
jgi:hypothetical protein